MMSIRLKLSSLALVVFMSPGLAKTAPAPSPAPSPLPPHMEGKSQSRIMLDSTKSNWVIFRSFKTKQYVYFTGVLAFHCALKEIRYGVNGAPPTTVLPLPACDKAEPFTVDPSKDKISIEGQPGAYSSITVNVTYEDGSTSPNLTYVPCTDAKEAETCGRLER